MYKTKSIYTELALETIKYLLKGQDLNKIKIKELNPELAQKRACFVSIHTKDGNLRGCIGTLEPVRENLQEEIISNAVSAASRDPRFNPLSENELDEIEISVDVLSIPEKINDVKLLDAKKYGVILSDGKYRRGVLLPNLEGVDTVDYQLNIVKRKAGLENENIENLEIYRFTSQRFL